MLQLTFPPNRSPQLKFYTRATATLVGSAINGTESGTRPTLYNFNISSVPDGDYTVDVLQPYGRFVLRKKGTDYLIAEEFWELDYLSDQAKDPGKMLVNQNYGGANNLSYTVNGQIVADASLEIFLFSDYSQGNTSSIFRLAESRQLAGGAWAIPVYLDPGFYVLRFYKRDVAGPDDYKLNVSFNPSEISVIKLN